MRWATLSHIHLDRVATPWLLRRFVDPDAEFEFVEWGLDGSPPQLERLVLPEGAIPFGIPGVELGLHDADGSCFLKVMRKYNLDDPALPRMEGVIAAGICHALGTTRLAESAEEEFLGAALDEFGTALGLMFDDLQHLEAAMPLYDALYWHCGVNELPADVVSAAPRFAPLRAPYLRAALKDAGLTIPNGGMR